MIPFDKVKFVFCSSLWTCNSIVSKACPDGQRLQNQLWALSRRLALTDRVCRTKENANVYADPILILSVPIVIISRQCLFTSVLYLSSPHPIFIFPCLVFIAPHLVRFLFSFLCLHAIPVLWKTSRWLGAMEQRFLSITARGSNDSFQSMLLLQSQRSQSHS